MKYFTFAVLSVTLAGVPILAAPATQPTDASSSPPLLNAPTTAPAPIGRSVIIVFPLSESSGASFPWVGKALQQDLVAELSHTTRAEIQASATAPADAQAALQAATKADAGVAIYGQFHAVGSQLRFTGQVFDVASGKAIGGFTATGESSNLFPLEDAVTGQVLRALPAAWLTVALPPAEAAVPGAEAPTGPPASPPPSPPTQSPVAGQLPEVPQYYSYTYPAAGSANGSYTYGVYGGYPYYGYPYYWGGYPYYYGPSFFFYGGFGGYGGYYHGHYGGGHYDYGAGHAGYHGGYYSNHAGHAYGSPGAFGGASHSGGGGGGGGSHGGGGHGK